jgi:peptidyl-prolyl cis-trans isomerase SurA
MKIFLKHLFLIIFNTCLWSIPGFAIPIGAKPIDRIIVVVNSEIVTESDVQALDGRLKRSGFLDDSLVSKFTLDKLKSNRNSQIEYLVDERLMESEIKRLNLSVTMERVEQEIRDIGKKNGMSRSELMNAIKAQGVAESEYQDFLKTRIERQSLIESEVASRIRISDDELTDYYLKKAPNKSAVTYEYSVAHIFLNPKKLGDLDANNRSELILAKLKSGESFEKLAEQYSQDPDFAAGGFLGRFKAGELNKEFEQALSPLSPGQVSGLVRSKNGLHILKLVDKKVIADPRFEKEKEKIRNMLFEKAFQKAFVNWLEARRQDSFIRFNAEADKN